MIELRWVRGAFKGDAVAENNNGESFRLQYRLTSLLADAAGNLHNTGDWIDVPTVKEE